jgi:tight adherence protein B
MFLVFIAILLITFFVILVATSPTHKDKILRHRLSGIRAGEYLPQESADSPLLREHVAYQSGWLETILTKFGLSRRLQTFLTQARVSLSAEGLILLSFVLAAVGFFLVFLVARVLPIELAAAGVLGAAPFTWIVRKRSRRLRAFNAILPDAIDMIARALHAGHSISGAIEMVAQDCALPLAAAFEEVFRQQNFGMPLREALLHMLERDPSQDLRVLVTAIIVQRETGGNLIEILDRTSFIIRERIRIHGEIRVHSAQGRLTGWILGLLPIILLLLISVMNPGYSSILFTDPMGRRLIYIGLGMLALGIISIHRIINGIEV